MLWYGNMMISLVCDNLREVRLFVVTRHVVMTGQRNTLA
jgi:hypothetical protein